MGSWFIMTYHRWMCSGYMVDKRPTIGLAKNNARTCCKLSWNCPYYWLFTCPPLEVWPFIYPNQVFLWIFSFSICQETTFGGHFLFQALEIDRSTHSKELSSTDLNQKPPTNLNCIPSTSTTSISFNFLHNQFVSHRNSSNKHQHHSHHCKPHPPTKKKQTKQRLPPDSPPTQPFEGQHMPWNVPPRGVDFQVDVRTLGPGWRHYRLPGAESDIEFGTFTPVKIDGNAKWVL